MIIYFALLIPVIAILYALIFQRKKVIWWEALLTVVIPILFVFFIKYLGEKSLEYSDEYWNEYGTKAEYYEDWDEWIEQTCTRTYPCGTDSDGNTEYCTETYDCSYVQFHPEHWELYGSCGAGFGTTIEREENNHHLRFRDLAYPSILKERLNAIAQYYRNKELVFMYREKDKQVEDFFSACSEIVKLLDDGYQIYQSFGRPVYFQYIYEGAQGLLLDKDYGFFPNVTRSNCGTKNLPNESFDYFLVTRAYQTRHGNGYMTNEGLDCRLIDDPNETNKLNTYQGTFRRTVLDIDLIEYAIDTDERLRKSKNKTLVITCVDHLKEFKFTYKGEVKEFQDKQSFLNSIRGIFISGYGFEQVLVSENCESKFIGVLSGDSEKVIERSKE